MRKPGQKSAFYGEKGLRLVRSWKVLLLLAESQTPLSTHEIHRKIHQDPDFVNNECGLQTIREDLKALVRTGFPVRMIDQNDQFFSLEEEEDLRGRFKNIRWTLCDPDNIGELKNPRHYMPTSADVLNLSLCRSLLALEVPSQYPLFPVLEKMLGELHLRMNQMLRRGEPEIHDLHRRIFHLGKHYLKSDQEKDNWDRFAKAIGKNQVLAGQYQNRDEDKSKPVDIAPLALWIEEGRSYVLGAGGTDHRIRSWRVDRFSELFVDAEKVPPSISTEMIQEKLKGSFRGYISNPVEIRLKARPEIAYLFDEYVFHPSQKVFPLPDGGLEIHLFCPISWGLEEWILGFGEFTKVAEPPELRISIKKRVVAMLANCL